MFTMVWSPMFIPATEILPSTDAHLPILPDALQESFFAIYPFKQPFGENTILYLFFRRTCHIQGMHFELLSRTLWEQSLNLKGLRFSKWCFLVPPTHTHTLSTRSQSWGGINLVLSTLLGIIFRGSRNWNATIVSVKTEFDKHLAKTVERQGAGLEEEKRRSFLSWPLTTTFNSWFLIFGNSLTSVVNAITKGKQVKIKKPVDSVVEDDLPSEPHGRIPRWFLWTLVRWTLTIGKC